MSWKDHARNSRKQLGISPRALAASNPPEVIKSHPGIRFTPNDIFRYILDNSGSLVWDVTQKGDVFDVIFFISHKNPFSRGTLVLDAPGHHLEARLEEGKKQSYPYPEGEQISYVQTVILEGIRPNLVYSLSLFLKQQAQKEGEGK
ncbi:MAG: hypothetical protein HZC02_03010 [Candidatus Levybacteria bacterium]|nr:hypothetical protein [Candidatus Levybacteria bacterium]